MGWELTLEAALLANGADGAPVRNGEAPELARGAVRGARADADPTLFSTCTDLKRGPCTMQEQIQIHLNAGTQTWMQLVQFVMPLLAWESHVCE